MPRHSTSALGQCMFTSSAPTVLLFRLPMRMMVILTDSPKTFVLTSRTILVLLSGAMAFSRRKERTPRTSCCRRRRRNLWVSNSSEQSPENWTGPSSTFARVSNFSVWQIRQLHILPCGRLSSLSHNVANRRAVSATCIQSCESHSMLYANT